MQAVARDPNPYYGSYTVWDLPMHQLQATLLADHSLFFWSTNGTVEEAIAQELPGLRGTGAIAKRVIAIPGAKIRRKKLRGIETSVANALPTLTALANDADVSASVHGWALAAKLGLELAARQRVVPSVRKNQARWHALLTRPNDRRRFERIAAALPLASRAQPTTFRGSIRVPTRHAALRGFVDATVDALYRDNNAYPGPARGWALEYAQALRSDDAGFAPRDARFQSVPEALAAWSASAETGSLTLGVHLLLPTSPKGKFRVKLRLHDSDQHEHSVPIRQGWTAGESLMLAGRRHRHPAHTALRALARASRVLPALRHCLDGASPRNVSWSAKQTWAFLSEGAELLRDSGIVVSVPDEVAHTGHQRLRARLRIETPEPVEALPEALDFRWEVFLGNELIDGPTFAELVSRKEPLVYFRGSWVVLDPAELERLPGGLPQEGVLPTSVALRAVLTGEHDGVPVVASEALKELLASVEEPGEVEIPSTLRGTLRPYQARGLAWLTAMGRLGLGACLADDMGLGKTIQLIAHLLARQPARHPTLVVCPTSVLGNWANELESFGPTLTVSRYHGPDRDLQASRGCNVVLTTYGVLVRDTDELSEVRWDVVALDEAQAIKNPSSRRAQAARKLKASHRIAMSGTPVENCLDELWSLMRFLVPGFLGARQRFRTEVAVPIERFGDERIANQLKRAVQPFLLRRLKTDPNVIGDLPDKIERREHCAMTSEQARLYEIIVEEHMERIAASTEIERRGHVLAMLTRLKQACNHPAHYLKEEGPLSGRSGKLARCTDLLASALANGERALVFTQYREMGHLLQSHLSATFGVKVGFYHGGTPTHRRDQLVDAFQNDMAGAPILIISLKAGGTGLNLTRATHVLHYDRWWNPAVEDQATDRAYRIGQRDNVQVHKLITHGTLEDRIDRLLEKKRALADQVVGAGEHWVTDLDNAALRRLVALGEGAVVTEERP